LALETFRGYWVMAERSRKRGMGPSFDVKALKEIAGKVRNMTLRVELAD
jgi:hypothetical protein